MTETMPIFPLGLVAFPGMTVPLHVFEDRYRAMVRHLLAIEEPEDRLFGIVAIREGYEVGGHETRSMYRTGCVVRLATVSEYDDGRFDIAGIGLRRMRVVGTDTEGPFVRAEVETLTDQEPPSVETAREAAHALATFAEYRELIGELRGGEVMSGSLPRDPEMLSYVLAATCSLTLRERQQLLESPTSFERLGLLRRLMRREIGAMTAIPSLPATEVARSGWSPN
jgi:Lon protease-like protein